MTTEASQQGEQPRQRRAVARPQRGFEPRALQRERRVLLEPRLAERLALLRGERHAKGTRS